VWVALDTTFASWESVSDSLQDTISEGPPALETATRELPRQRPFLANSEELFRRFRPAFASLAAAAPGLATAFRAGEPALRRSPALNRRLTRTLATLDRLGDDPRVPSALNRLTRTATLLQPTLAFITPAQSVCNYGTLFFRNVASMTSESDIIGSMLRIAPMSLPITAGSEGGPAATPANGPPGFPAGTTFFKQKLYRDSFLHSNPYPNTAAPGQPQECEAGNEGYSRASGNGENQLAIGNPGNAAGIRTEKTERRLP
jgi:hypothetical protein